MTERDVPTRKKPPEEHQPPGTSMFSSHERATETAPPYMPPVAGAALPPRPAAECGGPPPVFAPGKRVNDFEIQRLLGSGAFAHVYLARQVSLERLVALKVSANQGTEARTLAHLEHDHIVQVFTEIPDPELNLRYMCMQFVPGLTLDRIIANLNQREDAAWNGRTLLEILDLLCNEPIAFDLAGVNNRSALLGFDHAEVVCWMGARLAQALAHAHTQGVVHRDIKPANILVNRYGRPFLADFNIALNSAAPTLTDEAFGGTLSYMAPEHLDAFTPASGVSPDVVDARSDVYSLGVVLFVFLTGRAPFHGRLTGNVVAALKALAAERRAGVPSPRQIRPDIPELLDRIVRRCLDPEPSRRFQSAAELTGALEGCRELHQLDRAPGQQNWFLRWCSHSPFSMMLVLAVIPHLLGSAVNITYNQAHIVSDFTSETQRSNFYKLVLMYNAVVYPAIVAVGVVLVRRVLRGCRRLRQEIDLPATAAAQIRRSAMGLPTWTVILSAIGWFSGGVIFPLGLEWLSGPVHTGRASIYILFPVSFVLSGLIALTYSYFGVQFVVLRILYPLLWSDPAASRLQAQRELPSVAWRLRFFQFLAGLIPVGGAGLLIFAADDRLTMGYRLLLLVLLVLGMAGIGLATVVSNRLDQVILLLTGGQQRGSAVRQS